MKAMRKKFDAVFKAKVALAAIRGDKTMTELSSEFGVHVNQISQWRKKALEGLPDLFSGKHEKEAHDSESKSDELYQQIGRLKVELDFLKKKSQQIR